MTTIVNANGVTVVVPAKDVPASTMGSCAQGWFLCGAEGGPVAGCCPSGYACGTASCSAEIAGQTAGVAKGLPGHNGGERVGGGGVGWLVGGVMAAMMMILA